MQHRYRIQVRNGAGVDRYEIVTARTESRACDIAVRRVEAETGERWYAVIALVY